MDTGWGPEAGDPGGGEGLPTPDAGSLLRTLAMVGVAPESIDTVVLTHAHPDHMGGLVDPVTREPLLPNAEVLISDAELKLWTAEDAADRVGELAAMLVPGAQADLAALDERLRPIQPGSEVASGIHTVPAPGHTPGHMALIVEGDGEQLFLVGDSVTNIHSAFERPEWQLRLDVDGELAGRTRRRLLERAVADEMLILGYHFPFPGLGRALPYQGAFRWYPAGWTVLP